MSLELSNSIIAKTSWLYDGRETYCAELGEEQRTLAEIVDEISSIFDMPQLKDDLYFRDFRYYIQSMSPIVINRRGQPTTILWPDEPSFQFGMDRDSPTIEVMGQSLSRDDAMSFINYVFTNLPIDSTEDPRLSLIARLKAEDVIV